MRSVRIVHMDHIMRIKDHREATLPDTGSYIAKRDNKSACKLPSLLTEPVAGDKLIAAMTPPEPEHSAGVQPRRPHDGA